MSERLDTDEKTMSEVPNPAKNDVRRADIGVSRTKSNFGQETGDK